MHSSRKITYFTLFSAINLAVMGVSKTEPFYAMLKLASPFDVELEKYNFALLTLSLTVSIIFISVLIQVIAAHGIIPEACEIDKKIKMKSGKIVEIINKN